MHRAQARNRRLEMEHVIMRNIMRFVITGSIIAIAFNTMVVFG